MIQPNSGILGVCAVRSEAPYDFLTDHRLVKDHGPCSSRGLEGQDWLYCSLASGSAELLLL